MNLPLFKDTDGKPSLTATAFILGFLAVNLKLLASGFVVAGATVSQFSGTEYGVALAALGGIYILRRTTSGSQETNKD